MYYTKKERTYYNIRRQGVCQNLNITENQYNWLRRKGEALRKVYENNCNGLYRTDEEYNLAVNKVKMLIWQYRLKHENIKALKWYYQTDPRGASLYIDIKPIPEDSYTQANCIY